MKRLAIMAVLSLSVFALPALAEQKLINITEDTLADDSYRPVAGKEFLVAIKLVNVDIELNTETPISNEPIIFQTSVGTLSETEVTTNIYGEAITWLTTDTTPDTSHSITASAQNKPEITPITIEVKNIALPQDAPTAEELIQKVEENNDKIQDIKGDITVTSNAPWSSLVRQLKIWKKGEKQKVQELSPNPETFIRPITSPAPNPPVVNKEIAAYNPGINNFVVKSKEETQTSRYPAYYDCIDPRQGIIFKKLAYQEQDSTIAKFIIEDTDYIDISGCLIFQKEKQVFYQGVGTVAYTDEYQYMNIQVNTGIADSEFGQ